MTRLGKIARLPREIREELNVRLQNGDVGRLLVEWLNGLPAAQEVLKARFDGRAITEQNLNEWKQGGYEDWVRHQDNCAYALMLTEMASDLEEEAGKIRLEERLAALMAVALARLLREAEEAPAGPERTKMILDVARQLSQLRRDGQQAVRVRMERERWEQKQAGIAVKEREEAYAKARAEAIWEQTKAESKKEPPHPDPLLHKCVEEREMERRARAQGIHARNSSADSLPHEKEWNEAARGKSDQIQSNQTCEETKEDGKRKKVQPLRLRHSRTLEPNQTRSTRFKRAGNGSADLTQKVGWGWMKDSAGETPTDAVGTTALPSQTQSRRIKPNQTKSNLRVWGRGKWPVVSGEWLVLHSGYTARSSAVKPSQTQSNSVNTLRDENGSLRYASMLLERRRSRRSRSWFGIPLRPRDQLPQNER
jgi:hypothetical protein